MAGQVATLGTPHLPFCKEAPCIYPISISLHKIPNLYNPFHLQINHFLLPPLQLKREKLSQNPLFFNPNPSFKDPSQDFKDSSRASSQRLHLQPPTPRQLQDQLLHLKLQQLVNWSPSSSSWIKLQIQPIHVSTLTHQDLEYSLFTYDVNSCMLAP